MKNILGTTQDLELFNKNGKKVYSFTKGSYGFSWECIYDQNDKGLTYKSSNGYSLERTFDKNGKILTHKDSNGYSYEYTYDQNGNKLTYKDSNGVEKVSEQEEDSLAHILSQEMEYIKTGLSEVAMTNHSANRGR